MKTRITVVIPVYNVEKYLDRCIRSVLEQTIDDFFIILVDDGSTDNSGRICDKWGNISEKISVFHKSNGGLSDARNFGVQHTETEYVTFIDSDDYVEPQYIELLKNGLSEKTEIVITGYVQEYENNPLQGTLLTDYEVMTPKFALEQMCYEKIPSSAWGKLYPTKFILDFPFPNGKLYEDLLTLPIYIGMSNSVAFNRSKTYHYVQRKGSIRQNTWNSNAFDVIEGADNILEYISVKYPDLFQAGIFQYFYASNELYVRAFSSENYIDIIEPIRKRLRIEYKNIMSNSECDLKHKLQFGLMVYFPRLYRKLWIYKRGRKIK